MLTESGTLLGGRMQCTADSLGSRIFKRMGLSICVFSPGYDENESKRRGRMKKVALVMGSDSDLPIVEKAIDTLRQYGVPFQAHVLSAHRCPEQAAEFAKNARADGVGVIIAAAGKAAHLAGAVAANTTLPVIGIPIKSSLDGIDALLSTVQMPSGIPVATVAIDGAVNAALLSVEILALEDQTLADALAAARAEGTRKVLEKNAEIEAAYFS